METSDGMIRTPVRRAGVFLFFPTRIRDTVGLFGEAVPG